MTETKSKTLQIKNSFPKIENFGITKGVKQRISTIYRFSKAKRYLSQCYARSHSPSPVHYRPEQYSSFKPSSIGTFCKEQKFYLSKKQIKCKTQVPSPDKYRPKQAKKSIRITIPHAYRLGFQSSRDIPAVGSYQLLKQSFKSHAGIKFPQQKRKTLTNASFGPAPNQYTVHQSQRISNNQTFNKTQRLTLKLDTIPGVGEYSIFNLKKKHSPSANITSQRRKNIEYTAIDEPGPASYTSCPVQKYKHESKLTKVIFNKAEKIYRKHSLMPGPGDYNISENRQKLKGAFLTSRYCHQNQEQFPGPSQYKPKLDLIVQKTKSTKIGKALKLVDQKQLSPGPLDYHPERIKIHFNSAGFTFPKQRRQLE